MNDKRLRATATKEYESAQKYEANQKLHALMESGAPQSDLFAALAEAEREERLRVCLVLIDAEKPGLWKTWRKDLGSLDGPYRTEVIIRWVRAQLRLPKPRPGHTDEVATNLRRVIREWHTLWEPAKYRRELLRAFRRAGFVTDTSGCKRPRLSIKVYRGCSPTGPRGFCWTTDRKKAQWFVRRLRLYGHKDARVISATVQPRHVLGIFNGRSESEIIVDPKGIHNETSGRKL